ncbi:MAG: sulfatase-like hydrolase/transferase [candidate division Zixibacteria bacterium]|nr:sulfatase-like hydrolase/transferase [candidate division Zixibacteria bacterium]
MTLRPERFLRQLPLDISLWLFCVGLLAVHRLVFLFIYRGELEPITKAGAIILAILAGARFDAVVASTCILPSFVLSVVCVVAQWENAAARVRRILGVTFALFTPILCTVSLGYYKEFHELFGPSAFGIYYDDAGAVTQDVLKEFNIIPIILGTAAVAFIAQWLIRRILRSQRLRIRTGDPAKPRGVQWAILASAVAVLLASFYLSPRAPTADRPGSEPPRDEFLSKTMVNPYIAARDALADHFALANESGILRFLPDGNIRTALRLLDIDRPGSDDLDSCITRHAAGPKGAVPRHIFIVVGETYDMWPRLPKYASLRLTEHVQVLADSGFYLTSFLPASDGTMLSLNTIITGLADAGLVTNYQKASAQPYPSSLPEIFKRLGYRTSLYYGGFLTWQRIGLFSKAQGFEHVYGANDIPHATAANEWGVDDQYLYDFILKTINDTTPTFSLIMTTTYHPPFSVDVYAKGYPVREVPESLRSVWGNTVTLKMLGHQWWADLCMANFVRRANQVFPNSVFAITGDHSHRKFINGRPGYYERTAVPLIFYGPSVLSQLSFPANAAGSHIDIGTTLIELAASSGFAYQSLGQDLLSPRSQFLGIGRDNLITPDFEVELADLPKVHQLHQRSLPSAAPDIRPLREIHDAIHAISWWRIRHGAKLPPETQTQR